MRERRAARRRMEEVRNVIFEGPVTGEHPAVFLGGFSGATW